MVHHLEIIGESANNISLSFQTSHPEIPWRKMIGMRHILMHGYFEIDLEIVWNVIEKELPQLKASLIPLL
jgi:uncharacterized protein with HEPN domain